MLPDWIVPALLTISTASTPLVFAAVGEIVVEKSGVLNLGVEGMMVVGAIAAFAIGVTTGSATLAIIGGALAGAGLEARMLLQVHDELVFEVPEGELNETARLVRRVMEGAAQLSLPLVCEPAAAANWAEAH